MVTANTARFRTSLARVVRTERSRCQQRLPQQDGRAAARSSALGHLARAGDVGDRRAVARRPQPRDRPASTQPATDGGGAGPFTTQHSALSTQHSPLTTHHSPPTTHHH
eukprot:scaffold21332_cov57-Phaeocystis_antarctica.AAC.4